MISFFEGLFFKFKELILSLSLAIGTLFFVYFKGKREGEAKIKQDLEKLNKEAQKERIELDDKIKTLDDDSLSKRASRWVRNP